METSVSQRLPTESPLRPSMQMPLIKIKLSHQYIIALVVTVSWNIFDIILSKNTRRYIGRITRHITVGATLGEKLQSGQWRFLFASSKSKQRSLCSRNEIFHVCRSKISVWRCTMYGEEYNYLIFSYNYMFKIRIYCKHENYVRMVIIGILNTMFGTICNVCTFLQYHCISRLRIISVTNQKTQNITSIVVIPPL